MTVESIITQFGFKADTAKAEKFEKVTNRIKEGVKKTDDAWTKVNSKLAQGFQSRWFDQFSQKVTDLRRVQLFLGGIRRGLDFASNVVPGMKMVSNAVTGVVQKYNQFTSTLINSRSAMRSFGILLGKTAQGIIPMVKAEIAAMVTIVKDGFLKMVTFIRTINFSQVWTSIKTGLAKGAAIAAEGIRKIGDVFRNGFAKFHEFLLNSNNVFLNKLGASISRIQTTIGNIKGISALGSKIQSLTANIPGLGQLTSAFSAFGLGAVAAITGIVVAIVAVVKAIGALVNKVKEATKDFLNFESGMKGVQRVTLASAEDMKRLESAALKAGEASVFGVKDAADAQKFLAMAGLSVDEVIGALPGTLQLAAAAEMDLARAADIATNIMSSNSLGVEDLTRVNDILAYSASHSNQNVEQLGSAIQNIGPAGKLAALSVEDLASWLSILANNGLRGEEAGTMVRNAIMDLTNPSKTMIASLKKANINLSNFVDSAGKIKNLNSLLMALQNMDEASRAAFLGTLDARTYRALAPIITGNVEALAAFNEELSKSGGTAQKMADLAFQGLDGAIKEYKSKMETANVNFIKDSGLNELFEEIVRIGSASLPVIWNTLGLVLKPFVKILTVALKVIRTIITFLGGMFKVINSILRAFLSIIDVALKPILDAVDQLSTGIKKAFDLLSDMGTGPLQWVQKLFTFIGKIVAGIVKGIFLILGPLLFFVDVLLNLFLIILPNVLNSFFLKVEELWKNSIMGKIGDKLDTFAQFITGGGQGETGGGGFNRTFGTSPSPGVVTNNGGNSTTVGKIEMNTTVQGGLTNADTAAAVNSAVRDALSSELRILKQEVH